MLTNAQSSVTPPPDPLSGPPADDPKARGGGRVLRALGLGLITGAADDDCSAIGTYAQAGAQVGNKFLWTAPATFPMMFAVVYLSAKLGQVSGRGLFHAVRDFYPKYILYPALIGVLIGNTFEAGADVGGMAAAIGLLIPASFHIGFKLIVVGVVLAILALQFFGSYVLIRNVFRWLALALLAYVVAGFLAKPDWGDVLKGTFVPHIEFTRDFLSLLVATIGTSLSAYLYTWQSNEEVEEEIAQGRDTLEKRLGATDEELKHTRQDIVGGMFFSNLIMFFIILATGATLFKAGKTDITTAADAAKALEPLAGKAAGLLFTLGVVGVGFLAVPVMTTGAAYDLAQVCGWRNGLNLKPAQAKAFYAAIVAFTLGAVAVNLFNLNPMKVLVWSGIVQGFSTPPLMLLIMLMTNRRDIMGDRVNGRAINVLGWVTTAFIFAATIALVVTWVV